MRKKFFALAVAIFFLSFAFIFSAETAPINNYDSMPGEYSAPENLAALSPWDYKTYKVGYVKDTSFLQTDRPNHKVGYGYEYMEFLARYAHCKFEYVEYNSWNEIAEAWAKKEIDMMPGMPGDYRKLPNAQRTAHVIGRFPMELVVHDKKIKSHMKIGTVSTNYPAPDFPFIAQSEGFTYEEISFPAFQEMIDAYNSEKIDGYVAASLGNSKEKDVVAFFDRQSYRLIVHADEQPLLNKMDLAMDQMLLIQTNIRDRLSQKYMRTNGFPLTLSKDERNYLAARKKIKAAIFIYAQPFAYYDEDGKLVGFFPEILERISKDLGIEIEIVETSSIKETHDLIASGAVDIVADAILDQSWASDSNINVTQSYLTFEYSAVTRNGYVLDLKSNPKVAVVDNMIYTKNILNVSVPEDKLVHCNSWEECLQAVNEGRADVTYILKSAVPPLINKTGTYGLEISSTTYFTEPCTLGVYTYENDHLWHILNKEINHIENNWILDVLNKHRMLGIHITPMWLVYNHPISVIIFITLLAIGIGWFFVYRDKMQQRHFDLVQHMAYTDLRYDLPNVSWLEKEIPDKFKSLQKSEPNFQTYFVIFAMESGATIAEETGRKMIDKKFKDLAAEVKQSEPVIFTAAGIDIEHLICFCKAENLDNLVEWAEDIVEEYSYIDTADQKARIVLHTKAGITDYTPKIYIQQAIDRALSACHHKSNEAVKVFDEKLEEQLTTQHLIESKM